MTDQTLSQIAASLERIAERLDAMAPAADRTAPVLTGADAYHWEAAEGRLVPVPKVARVPFGLLKGIDNVRDILLNNTLQFAKGFAANNALLWGARGMGKSSLVNALIGEEVQRTAEVREKDRRGRHTTTRRELLLLPGGGLVIDTPGLRELQLWDADSGYQAAFVDVEALAVNCRFRDCSHDGEPGCAVLEAVEEGLLSEARLDNYRKLQAELRHMELKQDRRAQIENKQRVRAIHRAARDYQPRS